MRKVIFDESDLKAKVPVLNSKLGSIASKVLVRLLALNRVNSVYAKCCHLESQDFTTAWLKNVGVEYSVENKEILDQLPEGAFITVSNHSYGAIDGIIMVDLIAKIRPDYKFMVNEILMYVEAMSSNFIGVKPKTTANGSSVENTSGLKQTLRHLSDGHPMGFFPAGAVANFYDHPFKVTDKEWQSTIIRLIQAAKVPVVPIYIHGNNSIFFRILGRIHWQLRSFRMPHEIFNKRGKTIRLTVGKPITPEEQKHFKKLDELSSYLRAKTFELKDK